MAPGVTFAVDDVEPASERLAERDDLLEERVKRRVLLAPRKFRGVEASVPRVELVRSSGSMDLHPVIAALQRAYAEHRPFVLTPDAVAITIGQGVALHIRENHEALRRRFVRHAGRKTLAVDVDDPRSVADWEAAIAAMAGRAAEELGQGPVNLFTRPFSTTGPLERVAAQIALMDAFAPYFDYEVIYGCGIPTITLAGTADDWRDIRARVEVLAEWDLEWWAAGLRPLCDQWIATAEGRIDRLFWQRIYSSATEYLEQMVTGWIVRLFPYLGSGPATSRLERNDISASDQRGDAIWLRTPVPLRAFPSGLSQVEVRYTVKDKDGDWAGLVDLMGGFVGVAQAEDGLALAPQIGWAVCEATTGRLWEKLEAWHEARPAAPRRNGPGMPGLGCPALFVELYTRYRSIEMWGGALRVRPLGELDSMAIESPDIGPQMGVDVVAFADLPDGSILGYVCVYGLQHPLRWTIVHCPDRGTLDPARIVVVARTPLELWQKLLDGDAPYFLSPEAALHGSLADALSRDPVHLPQDG